MLMEEKGVVRVYPMSLSASKRPPKSPMKSSTPYVERYHSSTSWLNSRSKLAYLKSLCRFSSLGKSVQLVVYCGLFSK